MYSIWSWQSPNSALVRTEPSPQPAFDENIPSSHFQVGAPPLSLCQFLSNYSFVPSKRTTASDGMPFASTSTFAGLGRFQS